MQQRGRKTFAGLVAAEKVAQIPRAAPPGRAGHLLPRIGQAAELHRRAGHGFFRPFRPNPL